MKHTEIVASDWDKGSDTYYQKIYAGGALEKIIANPAWAFPPEVWKMLCAAFSSMKGKRVLVPSSGDNGAAFAFHLLGAKVTSVDISARQLANAKQISARRGWDIAFIKDDSMKLHRVPGGAYDLVYTSNGVHVWIDNLQSMYQNFIRVLKPEGHYIWFETHPFIRPFDGAAADDGQFVIQKRYEDTGPFGDLPRAAWRGMDLVNAMVSAGFYLRHMEEFHPLPGAFDSWWYETPGEAEADNFKKYDWNENPWAALPQWIGFWASKEAKRG